MKWLLVIVVASILVFVLYPSPAPKPVVSSNVCGSYAPACIKMTTLGKSYQFNDFKFMPNNCISFIQLPEHKPGSYCGVYQLTWVGPNTTPHAQQSY